MPDRRFKVSKLRQLAANRTTFTFQFDRAPIGDVSLQMHHPVVTPKGYKGRGGLVRKLVPGREFSMDRDRGVTKVVVKPWAIKEITGDELRDTWDLRFTLAYPVTPSLKS